MSDRESPDWVPESMPAPQLPNLPASPDDPFQPDPSRNEPITVPPNSVPLPRRRISEEEPTPGKESETS